MIAAILFFTHTCTASISSNKYRYFVEIMFYLQLSAIFSQYSKDDLMIIQNHRGILIFIAFKYVYIMSFCNGQSVNAAPNKMILESFLSIVKIIFIHKRCICIYFLFRIIYYKVFFIILFCYTTICI